MNRNQATGTGGRRQSRLSILFVAAQLAMSLAACDGTAGSAPTPPIVSEPPPPPAGDVSLTVRLFDVTGAPITGADVTVTVGTEQRQATSDVDGHASFLLLPPGELTLAVVATDFEPVTQTYTFNGGAQTSNVWMRATRAWAIGRAFVLGTRMVDRASNGTTLTFSADIAVIGENSQALETLTSADFSLYDIDCGWGGPRDCASDAAGNATGSGGWFVADGGVQEFEYRPGATRHPWLTSVLVERSTAVVDWDERLPALKTLFTALGGNNLANLLSIQIEGNATTLTQLGPFTSDGSIYLDAIDQLSAAAGDQPAILSGLLESIRRAAAAASGAVPGTDPSVLVLATPWMTVTEINAATALAQRLGVHISTVAYDNFGFPEMAVRTGGFVVNVPDPRQLRMVFGAIESVLAGTMPYYRMQFRIKGSAGTFVSGGNAKLRLVIRVPSDIINGGVWATFDVAIP